MVLKNLFARQQWRNRHREKTYGHGERRGGGEMYGKSNMETYITICKIDCQREFAIWLRSWFLNTVRLKEPGILTKVADFRIRAENIL